MLFLLTLLVSMVLVLWHLAQVPFSPWHLLAWPVGIYASAWIAYSIWERLRTLGASKTDVGRWR
jgi:hypothetical protein